MKQQDYHTSITVDANAHDAFNCINSVTKWWTENLEGGSQKADDEFIVRFGDVHYSRQKLIEVVPDKKVVWLVTDSQLNFITNREEWTNQRIVFEIITLHNQVQVHFTQVGLVPGIECYESCSNAWRQYIEQSLRSLITTGEGQPARKENTTRDKMPDKRVPSR